MVRKNSVRFNLMYVNITYNVTYSEPVLPRHIDLERPEDQDIFTSVISGFNYYILCNTSSVDDLQLMSERFSEVVLKVPSLKLFCDSIAASINAKHFNNRNLLGKMAIMKI